ncbi:MAG: hypothetical protein E5X83_30745 [Mesorhizobium sp.]|nr:MAG: hypothetical protein EOR82_23550 [Mesorhizobium sp.]TIO21146.1 MAG: hypothetical protein E5X83_30745 [Mesorhizobium sp.]TJV54818.1 MAG: hypothetical protein E5X82_30115 [Mesorhizobium sp.]
MGLARRGQRATAASCDRAGGQFQPRRRPPP